MMAISARDESLPELLARFARRSPDAALVSAAGLGLGGAIVAGALFGRAWWAATAFLLAIGAFGGWAMADRELTALRGRAGTARGPAVALTAVRFLCGAAAALSLFLLLAGGVGFLIGPLIS
jgi:hypothetical protein